MLQGVGYNPSLFPGGIEGDLTLTNATGGDLTTTITRPVFYRTVTLNATAAGKQLLAMGAGGLLFCEKLVLTNSKCIVHCDGGSTGGAAGVIGGAPGIAAVSGGTGNPGIHPTASSDTEVGGRGGRAGGNSANSTSGVTFDSSTLFATGQSSPAPAYDFNTYTNPVHLYTTMFGTARNFSAFTDKRIVGGTGGAGGYVGGQGGPGFGSGDSEGGGGNGGGAAGLVFVCAKIIDISGGGIIRANGGNGDNATNGIATHASSFASGGSGGGGGGGGGVILVYGELRQGTGLIQANGGNGGNGGNGAVGPGSPGGYHSGGGGGGAGGLGGTIYYFTQTTIGNQVSPGAAGTGGTGGTDV